MLMAVDQGLEHVTEGKATFLVVLPSCLAETSVPCQCSDTMVLWSVTPGFQHAACTLQVGVGLQKAVM